MKEWEAWADRHAEIRRWRSAVIETRQGRLVAIRRRWGRRVSWWRAQLEGRWWHRWRTGDRCRLYYYQPLPIPDYLTLAFVVSTRETRLATFRRALTVLDEIARLKGSWAIVCQPMNERISDRLLARWGWEPHCRGERGRHFIKRFGKPFRWSEEADISSRCGVDEPGVALELVSTSQDR